MATSDEATRSEAYPADASTAPKRQRSADNLSVWRTTSREGYFGDMRAVTDSNAAGPPRIVLDASYGQSSSKHEIPSPVWAEKLGLTGDQVARELAGCAGRYEGKVVIVTGGGRGIGEGCARVFFEAGSNVVIADRNEATGRAVADELSGRKDAANNTLFVKTDVSVVSELDRLVERTMERFGRLDCVIVRAQDSNVCSLRTLDQCDASERPMPAE